MTAKLFGAACVALAAGTTLRTFLLERRQEDRLLQCMAAALDMTTREIRWRKRLVLDIFTDLSEDAVVGNYFAEIRGMLNRKIPLQLAWNSAFNAFPICKTILLEIDLGGDEKQMLASLEQGAEALRRVLAERRGHRGEETKLSAAVVLSAAGGLILLLL